MRTNRLSAPTFPKRTDVLVVGAGPMGAILGAYLAGQGIDVTVIDKRCRVGPTARWL
ncbi:MAG: FAD-dependent monooxygenase [Bacteroidetes bacterium]|nr:FAD-dependent monooxygenase [Fibrella sp.]